MIRLPSLALLAGFLPMAALAQGAPPAAGPAPAAAPAPASPPAPPLGPAATTLIATGLGVPEALRGPWFAGGACTRPEAMLFLTARAAVRLPAEGPPELRRFSAIGLVPGGWTLGSAPGPQAPRLALRSPGPERLETAEPAAKTRDDRLPGAGATLRQWQRCPSVPAALAALHAEGLASLAALEHIEAACGQGALVAECLAALFAQADVSGDGALSVAELARVARGGAWLAAVRAGTPVAAATANEAGAVAAARRLMDSLDYDGDGRLSQSELVQDRAGVATATGTAAGRPQEGVPPMPGLETLQGLLTGAMSAR